MMAAEVGAAMPVYEACLAGCAARHAVFAQICDATLPYAERVRASADHMAWLWAPQGDCCRPLPAPGPACFWRIHRALRDGLLTHP
jgi:hypothetical protein